MELKHDRKSYRTSRVLSSGTQIKVTDYHTPYRTSLEKALVASPLVFHKPEICERSKNSEKKLGGKRLISGVWFVSLKGVNLPSASYTNAQGAES